MNHQSLNQSLNQSSIHSLIHPSIPQFSCCGFSTTADRPAPPCVSAAPYPAPCRHTMLTLMAVWTHRRPPTHGGEHHTHSHSTPFAGGLDWTIFSSMGQLLFCSFRDNTNMEQHIFLLLLLLLLLLTINIDKYSNIVYFNIELEHKYTHFRVSGTRLYWLLFFYASQLLLSSFPLSRNYVRKATFTRKIVESKCKNVLITLM